MTAPVLEVDDLRVRFGDGPPVVDGLSYAVAPGRMLAIIGESGSGKSVGSRAVLGLLPPSARVSGSARLDGHELVGLPDRALRRHRGRDIAMIFQDPARSLNPTMTVGDQVAEAVRSCAGVDRRAARARALELLRRVRLAAPEQRMHAYPHQLSGGMRQRVMIAIALAGAPRLLIADEATTALDVTTQAQIMDLLVELQTDLGTAVVLISHDLSLAACYADEVVVMYAGRAVERAPTATLFGAVAVPYTRALLDAIPQPDGAAPDVAVRPVGTARPAGGCAFRDRCPSASEACAVAPPLTQHRPGHWWACWHPEGREA